jgi:hypothetical protein
MISREGGGIGLAVSGERGAGRNQGARSAKAARPERWHVPLLLADVAEEATLPICGRALGFRSISVVFPSAGAMVRGLAEAGDFAAQFIDPGVQFAQGTVGGLGVFGSRVSGMARVSGAAAFAGGVPEPLGLLADTAAFLGKSSEGEVLGSFEKMAVPFLGRGQRPAFGFMGVAAGFHRTRSLGTTGFFAPDLFATGRSGFVAFRGGRLPGRFRAFGFLATDLGSAVGGVGTGTVLLGLEGKRCRQQRKKECMRDGFQVHGDSGCFHPDEMKSKRQGQAG